MTTTIMNMILQLWLVLAYGLSFAPISTIFGFQPSVAFQPRPSSTVASSKIAVGYEPKWKKKETLAEQMGPVKDLKEIGLKGTIPVVFKQGDVVKTTMAMAGQPLREVAIQAGQFIKYGCGKGECGTCEALVNGQWVRPCSINVPADLVNGEEYVVQVKAVKNKAKSSGKFYSVRSFLYGFYNNVLGMVGMVAYKRNAKQNYLERMEYEELVRQKTLEKKRARAVAQLSSTTANDSSSSKIKKS
jgi:aerobic-type carbon monoxide dehydrogenase small subunit (CoxS/CutS family)